jgi:hypothetical protein
MAKRTKTIEVERTSSLSYEYLQELVEDVPKAYRDSIRLEHREFYYPYEQLPTHSIFITYERLETDEEEADRETKEQADCKRQEIRELEQLRHLKDKYKGRQQGQECLHKQCPECNGTGRKYNGQMCVHFLSCPCPKCTPQC